MVLLLLSLFGILIWQLVAEMNSDKAANIESLVACHGCHEQIDQAWCSCPYCHLSLKSDCPSCQRRKRTNQLFCPYCGHIAEDKR